MFGITGTEVGRFGRFPWRQIALGFVLVSILVTGVTLLSISLATDLFSKSIPAPVVQPEQQVDTAPAVVENPPAQNTQPDAPAPATPTQVQLSVILQEPDIHQIMFAKGMIYAIRITGSSAYHVWRTNDDGSWNWQDLGYGTYEGEPYRANEARKRNASILVGNIKIPLPEDRLWSGEPWLPGSGPDELAFTPEKKQLAQKLLGDLQSQDIRLAFVILAKDQGNPNVRFVGFALGHKDPYLPMTSRFFLTTDNQQTWELLNVGKVEWKNSVLPFTTLAVRESPGGVEIFIGAKGLMHGITP